MPELPDQSRNHHLRRKIPVGEFKLGGARSDSQSRAQASPNCTTKRRQTIEHRVFDGLAPFAFTRTRDQAASANSFGSARTITVAATGVISSAGIPTRWACIRIASGLTA